MARGQANYGWHLVGLAGNGNIKKFHSREYQADPRLRPKLMLVTADSVIVPLTVNVEGGGTVTSDPSGVSCENKSCLVEFPQGADVRLTATPSSNNVFAGWQGACSGIKACLVTMDQIQLVTATFRQAADTTTVVLQDGVKGYAGTRDTYLYAFPGHDKINFGTRDFLQANVLQAESRNQLTMLTKFSVYESEGGPIPDGTPIVSARLAVYKSSVYNYRYGAHRVLVPWNETETTWLSTQAGRSWTEGGGLGRGTDITVTPDGEGEVGWAPGWVEIDVTAGVQAMASGQANYGWHLVGLAGNGNIKKFHSREYQLDPGLRPKLTIVISNIQP